MNFIQILVQNEVRLRLRRLSSIVALLAVSFLSWAIIADPSNGHAMLVVNNTRVLYNSAALALGSASLASPLFSLIGFFLVRGRIAEDLRSGIGSVIGASQVGNMQFIFARWLGGVAYLLALSLAFLATVLVCHLMRGEGPIELGVYLLTYAMLLLPMILFAVSCAILFDSFAFLMGKLGDVLYFFVWIGQIALISAIGDEVKVHMSPWLMFDFTGLVSTVIIFKEQMHSNNVSIGGGTFDAKLAAISLPHIVWGGQLLAFRLATFALALVPLIPAMLFFHRYSPDRVKAARAQQRRTPVAIINQWLRPLAGLSNPLFALAAKLPGLAGQVLADIALIFATAPSAIALLIICNVIGLGAAITHNVGILVFSTAVWGILVSDLSTRDFSADCLRLTGVAAGGSAQRYVRHVLAAFVLGVMFSSSVLLRWLMTDPQHAAILLVGLLSLAALATLLGRTSRTPRTFMSLFMFWLYVATQTPKYAPLDVVGFNGSANLHSLAMHAAIATAALLAGVMYNRWREEV